MTVLSMIGETEFAIHKRTSISSVQSLTIQRGTVAISPTQYLFQSEIDCLCLKAGADSVDSAFGTKFSKDEFLDSVSKMGH